MRTSGDRTALDQITCARPRCEWQRSTDDPRCPHSPNRGTTKTDVPSSRHPKCQGIAVPGIARFRPPVEQLQELHWNQEVAVTDFDDEGFSATVKLTSRNAQSGSMTTHLVRGMVSKSATSVARVVRVRSHRCMLKFSLWWCTIGGATVRPSRCGFGVPGVRVGGLSWRSTCGRAGYDPGRDVRFPRLTFARTVAREGGSHPVVVPACGLAR